MSGKSPTPSSPGTSRSCTEALAHPPQTNEPGRAALLALGIFAAVRKSGLSKVRLLELGASAGLNLNADRYRITGPDWSCGPPDGPLSIATGLSGVAPLTYTIVDRRGCDLRPIDASTPDGAQYLTSFVWPFDLDRHARLAAALEIQRAYPVTVDRAPAAEWLAERLAERAGDDVLTVVWQSITEQYWPAAERTAVASTIRDARERIPIARVAMEGIPPRISRGGYDLRQGPITSLDGEPLYQSHHHGPPLVSLRLR